MSVFVLIPLSKIISKENSRKTFGILFGIRAAILLFFDLFITTFIAIIDFIGVFVGAFLIVPFLSAKDNNKLMNNMPKNSNEVQQKNELNIESVNDNSPIVIVDNKYLNNENILLKNLIIEEIKKQGEDSKRLITSKLNNRRNIVIFVFGILTFIYSLMYFFNIELITCLICEGITLILYMVILKKFNIVNILLKKAKKNPNEDIIRMIEETKMNKKQPIFSTLGKTIITGLISICIPLIIFSNSKLIYFKYGDGYSVISYTKGVLKQNDTVVIPTMYKGKNIITIGKSAFKNASVKNVVLPKNLESIENKAFFNCSRLEKIYIPESVIEIRASAFENCSNLKSVYLSNGIVDIRASAFKNDRNLVEIKLPETLEYLGAGAFSNCSSLKEITIPNKVIEINGQTFEYCTSLKRINLHDDIISIHGENFIGCVNLDDVILPSKIKEIRGNTFENCSSLSNIIIPEGVTRIGGHAFYGCRRLKTVIVPKSVLEIGSSAFRQCSSLRSIRVPRNALVNEKAFKESPTAVIYY